jgi:hypothetical protein
MNQSILVFVFVTIGFGQLSGQTSASFGTCAFWQEQSPDAAKPASKELLTAYRIGLSHGFVFGLLADLPREAPSDPRWQALEKQHGDGLVEALKHPAFLVDAFDRKCGDYRNRRVRLSDIGLVVLLEVSGVSSQAIDRALEIMRAGGDGYRERAMEALQLSR